MSHKLAEDGVYGTQDTVQHKIRSLLKNRFLAGVGLGMTV